MIEGMLVESLSVAALAVVLICAVVRPFGRPEAVFAVPAAGVVIAAGAIPLDDVLDETTRLGPVIGFLAAVLVLAKLCADEGLFHACGTWMARRAAGRPRRLLAAVFGLASVITAALSLDATVVLLTPVVFATAARMGVRPRPHVYASAHLSNTASLLLPVSNLTNLLAFAATGLSFTRFALLMTLPWLVAIAVEYAVFRRFFAADLDAPADGGDAAQPPRMPLFALVTVALALAGFAVASTVGVDRPGPRRPGRPCSPCAPLCAGAPPRRRSCARPRCRSSPSSSPSASSSGAVVDTASATPSDTSCRTARACPPCSAPPPSPRFWPTSSTTCRPSSPWSRWPRRPAPEPSSPSSSA